jgi:hypothetical protein
MEQQKVIILGELEEELFELVELFFAKGYFGFLTSAKKYIDEIVNFIYKIPTLQKKQTCNNRYGNFYCSYKANSNTKWYVIFDIEADIFLMRYITNNHTLQYNTYIKGKQ